MSQIVGRFPLLSDSRPQKSRPAAWDEPTVAGPGGTHQTGEIGA
ncbi:hypothetical protein [Nocardia sp. NPDC058497]